MKKYMLLGIPIATLCSSVHADVSLNGFASIRATSVSSELGGEPFPSFPKDGDVSFKSESLFAIQAISDLGEGLTATVQFVAEGQNDFEVEARWAYVSYELNDEHTVSVGRFANPIFYQSQYDKVGYSHNFARLPASVYIDFDFSTAEGISLDSEFSALGGDVSTKVLYGNWSGDTYLATFDQNYDFGLKDITSLNVTYSRDFWKVYVGGMITEMEAKNIDDALLSIVNSGVDFALSSGANEGNVNEFKDAIKWDEKSAYYFYTGFEVDYKKWLFNFESVAFEIEDSSDAKNEAYYVSLGRRMGNFVLTAHVEDHKQSTDFSTFSQVSNPILNATANGLHTNLSLVTWDGSGITLRYDFHDSAALKIDYFEGERIVNGVGDYKIISAGVDLVF